MRLFEGKLIASSLRVAIVASRFNDFIVGRLIDGARDALERHGVAEGDITLARVPGAWEIPLAASRLAARDDVDAVVCLGAVIRGSTPHFDYVAAEVSKGVAQAALASGKPISFGVLTCDTVDQAVDRAGTKAGNKGFDAAVTAIEMANLLREMA